MDEAALGTSALLALFLVPVVSLIKRPNWSHNAKYLLSMCAALVCAVVGAIVDGHVKNAGEFVAYAGTAFASSNILYNTYFMNTELETKLAEK